ncbi:MAG TPA: nuclear transport factor 2 family protein [Phenylobacterium sp.]|uniref:nuclear transport factor 2 family protein n=1 Tax=Phenylobacterium sp. TaxID=1871053 RepID=UPI002CD4716C|nr:nuclear transport factor 2 family protein [Phenylobacterium sp.]HXA38961.1 nuclear transport factor 2 family protein [Phenylobacterium sp.]
MPKKTVALAALCLVAAAAAQAAPQAGDPAPVIAAEHAFAARAAEIGVAPSFLEFMTDEAIVFSPDPLLARAVYGARPAPKPPKDGGTLLNWWPNFAGVARSGDLGFTTGPATVNGGKPGIFYVTVWTRRPDGSWKWIYDGGVEADGTSAPGPASAPVLLPPGDARAVAPDVAMQQVRSAEIALAARAKADTVAAYKAVLAPDARVQGSKLPPATTPAAADKELATRATTIAFGPIGGGASKAGDLAWTYGDAKWDGGRGHYVRVWQRRTGKWALVFDQIVAMEK